MNEAREHSGEPFLLRVGAIAAISGTVLQVAAGTSQAALLSGNTGAEIAVLADQPAWMWPAIYLAFIVGALLWVAALVALASMMSADVSWALGRLAVAVAIVGATLHVTDGVLNAVTLAGLARDWAAATEPERGTLTQIGELLLRILDGTWAGVITLFHGLPFVLAGLAVALSPRFPAWLGWIAVIGGAGSLVVGVAMLFGAAPAGLAVPFAVVLSLFMVVLGWLMWPLAPSGVEAQTPPERFASDPQPRQRTG